MVNLKNKKLKQCLVFGLFLMGIIETRAQVVLAESFNYVPDINLTSSSNWTASGSTNPIKVFNGNLLYVGTALNEEGNKVQLANNGQAAYKTFSSSSFSTNFPTLYATAVVNVASAQATGDFFLTFANGTNIANKYPKVYIKTEGAGFVFGVQKNTGAIEYETGVVRNFNQNYKIVLKYEWITGTNNDVVKLFINPTSSAEPLSSNIESNAGSDASSLTYLFLEQGHNANDAPTLEIDDILVGYNWSDVASAVFDYGDTQKSYDYDSNNLYSPAKHFNSSNLYLGAVPPDLEYTALSVANGADNNGTNGDGLDEDGIADIQLAELRKGVAFQISVSAHNSTGSAKTLYAWIDFNNDGKFQAEESTTVSVPNGVSSPVILNWTNLQTGSIVGDPTKLYMRLRLSNTTLNDNTTTADIDERSLDNGAYSASSVYFSIIPSFGEVEDYQLKVVDTFDYGDLPTSYEQDKDGNLLPAKHVEFAGFSIGELIDVESNAASVAVGAQNNTAGDNAIGVVDEDGLVLLKSVVKNATYSLIVPVSIPANLAGTKYLYGWLDLNGDGKFQVGEFTSVSTTSTTNTSLTLNWTAAQTNLITAGTEKIYLRLRLSSTALNDFTTAASGGTLIDERSIGNGSTSASNSVNNLVTSFGEVEDYQLPVDLYDFGDAPIVYDTNNANVEQPARQIADPNYYFGALVDHEQHAQSVTPFGANNNGVNGDGLDEDGLDSSNLPQIRKGTPFAITVPVKVAATSSAMAWVDFNGDGKFQASEASYISETATSPAYNSITTSTTSATFWFKPTQTGTIADGTEKVYARIRLTQTAGADNTTTTGIDERSIADGANTGVYSTPTIGEIEDYQFQVVDTFDYGDLPTSYEQDKDGNLLPAKHAEFTGFSIGELIDVESNAASVVVGAQNNTSGDNAIGIADEDGLVLLKSVAKNAAYSLVVPVSIPANLAGTKYLYAWLDLNGDGKFQVGEFTSVNTTSTTSTSLTLNWTAAQTNLITAGTEKIYLRLRLSNIALNDFTTAASGGALIDERSIGNGSTSASNSVNNLVTSFGEVEDYQLPVDLYDFGDAPIVYDTNNANVEQPARQIADSNYFIGAIVDQEQQAQSVTPFGANNNGVNGDGLDEDGLDNSNLPQIRKGTPFAITVPVKVAATSSAMAWVDFNGDGKFQASEASYISEAATSPAYNSITTSTTSTTFWFKPTQTGTIADGTEKVYARIRLTQTAGADNTATTGIDERSIADGANSGIYTTPTIGEVEDYQLSVVDTFDYGDLPTSYEQDKDGNLLPAKHAEFTGFSIGELLDVESNAASVAVGAQNNTAGDNAIGIADEDGLVLLKSVAKNAAYSLIVPVSIPTNLAGTKYLYAWLDLNGDGKFQVGEFTSVSTTSTTNTSLTLNWTAAQTNLITAGTEKIYLRLRLSSTALNDFTTAASGGTLIDERSIGNGSTSASNSVNNLVTSFGEVEDYQLPVDLYDFGDAPIVYDTNNVNVEQPARQIADPNYYFGTLIDHEQQVQSVTPFGANNNGVNGDGLDEDGLTGVLPVVTKGASLAITVPVKVAASSNAIAWIDFNGDGKFQASEASSATQTGNSGYNSITPTTSFTTFWFKPTQTATVSNGTEKVYARIRLTQTAGADNATTTGIDERSIADGANSGIYTTPTIGEIEDYQLNVGDNFDYGDAPITYDTIITTNGDGDEIENYLPARQLVNNTLYIGSTPASKKTTPNHGDLANGDGSEEDGIVVANIPLVQSGTAYSLNVNVTNKTGAAATLYGWIDFDNNGKFNQWEAVTVSVPNNTNNGQVTLNWPAAKVHPVKSTELYLRLRLTTTAFPTTNNSFEYDKRSMGDGLNTDLYNITNANPGEIEDYLIYAEAVSPGTHAMYGSLTYLPAIHYNELWGNMVNRNAPRYQQYKNAGEVDGKHGFLRGNYLQVGINAWTGGLGAYDNASLNGNTNHYMSNRAQKYNGDLNQVQGSNYSLLGTISQNRCFNCVDDPFALISNPQKNNWQEYNGDHFIRGFFNDGYGIWITNPNSVKVAFNSNFQGRSSEENGWMGKIKSINNNNYLDRGQVTSMIEWEGINRYVSADYPYKATGNDYLNHSFSNDGAYKNNLKINHKYIVTAEGLQLKTITTIENISNVIVPDVYFYRVLQPKNNNYLNAVIDKNQAFVEKQPYSNPQGVSKISSKQHSTGVSTALITRDSRARAVMVDATETGSNSQGYIYHYQWQEVMTGDSAVGYASPTTYNYNPVIGLIYNIGNLAPGESTTVEYYIDVEGGDFVPPCYFDCDNQDCTKPSTATGQAQPSLSGVTTQQKRATWPQDIPNGWMALEAKSKGFVITRVANTSAISDPKEGMLIYDESASCVKLYDGSKWGCLEKNCD